MVKTSYWPTENIRKYCFLMTKNKISYPRLRAETLARPGGAVLPAAGGGGGRRLEENGSGEGQATVGRADGGCMVVAVGRREPVREPEEVRECALNQLGTRECRRTQLRKEGGVHTWYVMVVVTNQSGRLPFTPV